MSTATDAASLPTDCPDWCHGGVAGHRQAFDEGCPAGSASQHMSIDLVGTVRPLAHPMPGEAPIRAWGGGWNVELRADHIVLPAGSGWRGTPLLLLEMHEWGPDEGAALKSGRPLPDLWRRERLLDSFSTSPTAPI